MVRHAILDATSDRKRRPTVRVLLADDERLLADTVADGLRKLAMAVDVCYDGEAAIERLGVNRYDVAVLDRDMPRRTGDEVCRWMVDSALGTRILILTAASGIRDRVDGLGLGADDYLTKPFAFAELAARIQALARRPPTGFAAGARRRRRRARHPAAPRVPRRPAARPDAEGVRRAVGADARGRRGRQRRGAAREGVGRARRPVHQRGARRRDDAARASSATRRSCTPCRASATASGTDRVQLT